MTTVVERKLGELASDDSGQSLLEFLLLLPVLMGSGMILMRLNTSIQMSIVDQKYARAQALFLPHNSPYYPKIMRQADLFNKKSNQMVLGVSDNNKKSDSDGEDSYVPVASSYRIARNAAAAGPDGPPQEEPVKRGKVRIRNTISLCTHTITMQGASGGSLIRFDGNIPEVANAKAFLYCASKLEGLEALRP